MRSLFVLFIVVPLTELFLLFYIGQWLGFWPTVALTLGSGLLGSIIARREGLRVWGRWRQALAELRPPEETVVDGVLILAGAVLLIIPGVLTDIAGALLLLRPTRRHVARSIIRGVERRAASGQLRVMRVGVGPFDAQARGGAPSSVVETTGHSLDPKGPARLHR